MKQVGFKPGVKDSELWMSRVVNQKKHRSDGGGIDESGTGTRMRWTKRQHGQYDRHKPIRCTVDIRHPKKKRNLQNDRCILDTYVARYDKQTYTKIQLFLRAISYSCIIISVHLRARFI